MKGTFSFIFLMTSMLVFSQAKVIEPPMILVEGGSFQMGINGGLKKESPAHTVTLRSFYIGKYEVTQSLWQSVMGSNPSTYRDCDQCPVEQVSPEQVDSFLIKLNQATGKHYRLPTEAEWEYVAMGGNKSKGYKYSGSNDLGEVAWCKVNADNKTHIVGQKKPNELGIYDMSGNVWELCRDWYDEGFYRKSPAADPLNDKKAKYRVLRGGSWRSGENRCYSKARNRNINDHRKSNGGFRLVLDK
jgi:formylglycine-generating enzyme required for sulfatase activity